MGSYLERKCELVPGDAEAEEDWSPYPSPAFLPAILLRWDSPFHPSHPHHLQDTALAMAPQGTAGMAGRVSSQAEPPVPSLRTAGVRRRNMQILALI